MDNTFENEIHNRNRIFKDSFFKKGSKFRWKAMPLFVYESDDIDVYEKFIYMELFDHIYDSGDGQCNPSKKRLTKRCNISESKVRRALIKLKKEFFIDFEATGRRRYIEFFTEDIRNSKLLDRKKKGELKEENVINNMKKIKYSENDEQN
jgi:DNA-binding transcriptional regulator YhcF (GntR family)